MWFGPIFYVAYMLINKFTLHSEYADAVYMEFVVMTVSLWTHFLFPVTFSCYDLGSFSQCR